MDAATLEVTRSRSSRQGPRWLDTFVEATYFGHCTKHRFGKSDRNFFCTDCSQGPLCAAGVRESHAAHSTLQARKASYKDAVRVSDVHRILNISAIETYTINGAKIVFLHRRPQANPPQGVPSCEVCRRSFRDHVRFCSIQCKLEAIRGDNAKDASLTMQAVVGELEDTKMVDHGVIINPPGIGTGAGSAARIDPRTITNFRVHGEHLIRNLTPPRKLWNFLSLKRTASMQMQEPGKSPSASAAAAAETSAAGLQQVLPVDYNKYKQLQAGRPWPAAGKGHPDDEEQRLKYPQAIQHKGKRIIPYTGQLLSQFSLNSWLNDCKGKRKLDDSPAALPTQLQPPVAQGPEDMEFTFLPPAGRPRPATASAAAADAMLNAPSMASVVIVPKARRIVDTHTGGPHHPTAVLHSPTTSAHSDLTSEAQLSNRCCMDICCCLDDCTCLTLNSCHNVDGSCVHGTSSPTSTPRAIHGHGREGTPQPQ